MQILQEQGKKGQTNGTNQSVPVENIQHDWFPLSWNENNVDEWATHMTFTVSYLAQEVHIALAKHSVGDPVFHPWGRAIKAPRGVQWSKGNLRVQPGSR